MAVNGGGRTGSGQRMVAPRVEKRESEKSQPFTFLARVSRVGMSDVAEIALVINLSIINDDLELTAQCPVADKSADVRVGQDKDGSYYSNPSLSRSYPSHRQGS
ncbi:hypothetical protein E2C01_060367 [Portunus trituberculatus]|uniref:Uncharacterized protein n=1 Tax=Portunus trituberculatus TaxID=210409 RepID=A0A5B7H2A2_PORTR|nr:hypothetical protein [Portunus trituberculatus]